MTYLEIYNKLQRCQGITQLNRLRMAYRIGRTRPEIREAIIAYLDSEEPDKYQYPEEIIITIKEIVDGEETHVEYTGAEIQEKFRFATPLTALLYIDWLLKDPNAAIAYSQKVNTIIQPSREEIEAHIDPRILELAKKKEQALIESLESKLDEEVADNTDNQDTETPQQETEQEEPDDEVTGEDGNQITKGIE